MGEAAKRRIWDISQVLRPALPVWPGDTPFRAAPRWTHGPGSPVNVSAITLSTHAGAHADAPRHYHPGGEDVAALDLDPYLGPCRRIDARACVGRVGADFVAAHTPQGAERVLLRTYDRFPRDAWDERFTAVEPAAIDWLAAHGVRLIGLDSPSLDPQSSKTMDAHLAVLRAGMRVLEGLVLDDPPPGDYELIALPLPLEGLDAAPVRAILRELPR